MARIIDSLVFIMTAWTVGSCFRNNGRWDLKNGKTALRFFTVLSNLLSGFAALAAFITLRGGTMPYGVWLMKYVATASVTVTLLTVLLFLGPSAGYGVLFKGRDLYLHLFGPLLAVVSFCFFERCFPLSFTASLWGLAPVVLYGAFYLYRVVFSEEKYRWDDFYGYNKNGRWKISFAAMVTGTFLVCLLLRWLTGIGAV